MTDKKITFKQFLESEKLTLTEIELKKYNDFIEEKSETRSSILGWMFANLFKQLLQNESLLKGFVEIFKPSGSWAENVTYPAFESDHQRFDQLSNYYGNLYRGSFVFNYIMGALAVLAALIPVGFAFVEQFGDHHGHVYALVATAVELVLIFIILLVYKFGATHHGAHHSDSKSFGGRWHEKWIEYRVLAERFRYMEILYPLGIDPRQVGAALGHDKYWSWMSAYYAYRLSIVKAEIPEDVTAYKKTLATILKGQHKYHHSNVEKMERIHHRVHTFAFWLFIGTLLACVSHFLSHNPILTLLSGFLPALAAAMHGILANGEFVKTAEVSKHMSKQLHDMLTDLEASTTIDQFRPIAIRFHNIVIEDVLGWRVIFKDKNVPLA